MAAGMAVVFWVAYALVIVPEIVGAFFQKSNTSDDRHDRKSVLILYLGIALSITLAFYWANTQPKALIVPQRNAMVLAGAALMLAGAGFRWYSISILGRFFTRDVAIRPDHHIVRAGPYRFLRHPSYLGWFIAICGIGVGLDNWASLTALLTLNFLVFNHRMNVEEAALTEAFGDEYRDFLRQTSRLIPLLY